jgi:hypothetical protein
MEVVLFGKKQYQTFGPRAFKTVPDCLNFYRICPTVRRISHVIYIERERERAEREREQRERKRERERERERERDYVKVLLF